MEKIIVFGGSGFIGRHFIKRFSNDYEIVVISRHKRTTSRLFEGKAIVERLQKFDLTKIINHAEGALAIINLAGETVAGRWSKKKMDKIKNSRLDIDSVIVRVVRGTKVKPKVLIQGSAIGVYGFSRTNIDITEDSPLGQRGFLTKVARSHEEAIRQLEKLLRVVYIRTGFVIGKESEALDKMEKQFKLFLGGKTGSGNHWMSWIHVDDEVEAIKYLIENKDLKGYFNLTAPNPVQNKEFTKTFAKVLNKPYFLPTPSLLLKLIFGNMANEILLSGLKILPAKLSKSGFKFKYSQLEDALKEIYNK